MIVDHLSYGVSGGAAIAALRIHQGLRKRGIESRFWHAPGQHEGYRPGENDSPDAAPQPIVWPKVRHQSALASFVSNGKRTVSDLVVKARHLRYRPDGFEYFSTGTLRRETRWPDDQLRGDVTLLHWVGKLFDYDSFFETVPRQHPIVWVLHDMNPFTGGCHFSAGCDRFTKQCGNCPQISASSPRDVTFAALKRKRRLFDGLNLHVVAPSQWLSREAQRSVPFGDAASHRVIPYGLETELFTPVEKLAARRALGLDPAKRIVLFGAASGANRRKGFHCLLEAWGQLPSANLLGVMFGGGDAPDIPPGQAEIQHLGFIHDPERLSLLYSAADLFVLPSLEDNLPQTGMEAMACGTAVAAFDAGGIPDYVRPGETGALARTGDAHDLAREIRGLLDQPEQMREMGSRAREMILREYSQPVESACYAEFLQNLIDGGAAGSQAA